MKPPSQTSFRMAFGPGLLFAGTAIGLSHLVQSTRAGALYGLGLAGVILLIHVLKYPMFRFGAHYAAVSGESLVEGYRRQGWYAVWLLLLVMLSYMFFAIGAVGLLSAALIQTVVGIEIDTIVFGAGILASCAAFLMIGRFHWLDIINKGLVSVLLVSTVAAAIASLPQVEWTPWPPAMDTIDLKLVLFIAALGGFMPVSADSSVWQSMWTIAKAQESKTRPALKNVILDFNIGYWGAAFLALCFLLMGAAVMHGAGVEPAAQAAPFAGQILALYETALGPWAAPIVGASVISVMLTTTLAALDALPRVLVAITRVLRNQTLGVAEQIDGTPLYRLYVVLLALGGSLVLFFMLTTFRAFLDAATTIAFVVAPIIAVFNHRAVFNPALPAADHPSRRMRTWSHVGIAALTAFSIGYLYLLIGGYLG